MKNVDLSTKDSSLSKYGYDMVLAVTQASLNATLYKFLDTCDGKEQIVCYVKTKDDMSNIQRKYDKIVQSIGKDLFSMTPGKLTPEEQTAVDKAYDDENFIFAVKYKFGYLPDAVPAIIELSDSKGSYEKQKVHYNMHFAQFELVYIQLNKRNVELRKIVQNPESPFIFDTMVNLSIETLKTETISDPSVLKLLEKINNMGASQFSIQQLFLDVNSARLQTLPSISGLAKDSDVYDVLTRKFINTYWAEMNKKGKPIFNQLVTPTEFIVTPPSLIPTSFDFCVSPFRPLNGGSPDRGLFTLNYIIMTGYKPMPGIKEFDWNWIEASERDIHGSVAINSHFFDDRIIAPFKEEVSKFIKNPKVSLTCYKRGTSENVISLGFKDGSVTGIYKKIRPGTWQLSFSATDKADGYVGALDRHAASIKVQYGVQSQVLLSGNRVIHDLTVAYHVNFHRWDGNSGTAIGDIYKLVNHTEFLMQVNDQGAVVLVVDKSKLSSEIDSSFSVTKGLSLNTSHDSKSMTCDEFIAKRGAEILAQMTMINNTLNDSLHKTLTGMGKIWVFNGAQTFLFKDALFSDDKDLTAHLTYVNPK